MKFNILGLTFLIKRNQKSQNRNHYLELANNNPEGFAYTLRYYVCRMNGLQELFNQYHKRTMDGEKFSAKDKDTYRFIAEITGSMLFEITNVLKTIDPKSYEGMLEEARRKNCVIQLEKLEELRHATFHFPDNLTTHKRRHDNVTAYLQAHGIAIGFLISIIDKLSEEMLDKYPLVAKRFKAQYFG